MHWCCWLIVVYLTWRLIVWGVIKLAAGRIF